MVLAGKSTVSGICLKDAASVRGTGACDEESISSLKLRVLFFVRG